MGPDDFKKLAERAAKGFAERNGERREKERAKIDAIERAADAPAAAPPSAIFFGPECEHCKERKLRPHPQWPGFSFCFGCGDRTPRDTFELEKIELGFETFLAAAKAWNGRRRFYVPADESVKKK